MTEFDRILQEVGTKAGQYLPQYLKFVNAMNELISRGACLLSGATLEEDYRQYLRLVAHVEAIWDAAATLYRARSFPSSVYLSVATIEETGKIGVARFQMALRQGAREGGAEAAVVVDQRRRGNPFYSHPEKHLLAAGAGAIVNSRVDRILGAARVRQFLDSVDSGEIERVRQSALYADLGERGMVLPTDVVDEDLATFYVVLSGELMAEILGFEPREWSRLLTKVQDFERSIGHASE